MTSSSSRPRPPRVPAVLLLAGLLAACGSEGTGPEPVPPEIVVAGVEDGEVSDGPVTISITVAGGTYEATLNGASFLSGTTVSSPGSYLLEVEGRRDGLTSSLSVAFQIRLAGESLLVVRLLDLGANDSGGGGDAILLTDSAGAGQRHMLVDAGPAGAGASDPGLVRDALAALGVDTLAWMLLTHAHSDHYAGMEPVLEGITVERFVYSGQVRDLASYQRVIQVAEARAGEVVVPDAVLELSLGVASEPTAVSVIPALPDHLDDPSAGSSELNDGSLGASVSKGPVRIFLTGDGEAAANARWRTEFASLSGGVDVLKVGHHGANDAVFDPGSSTSSSWLAHTDPELQLISANGVTHPRVAALSFLQGRPSTRTYCTPVHGRVELRVAPSGAFGVTVERNPGADCVPGSEAGS